MNKSDSERLREYDFIDDIDCVDDAAYALQRLLPSEEYGENGDAELVWNALHSLHAMAVVARTNVARISERIADTIERKAVSDDLSEFVEWHNKHSGSTYIPNSEIGRFRLYMRDKMMGK